MKESDVWIIQILGRNGFSYKCIERRTGCPKHDIAKALRWGKVKLKDYRDGESKEAKRAINNKTKKKN